MPVVILPKMTSDGFHGGEPKNTSALFDVQSTID